jgi:hypothetical protein
MSASGVRRAKAALSSGCKPHPAIAPAGSNRSSHGGNEARRMGGAQRYPSRYGGVANGHRTCSKVMGFASAQPILRADRAFPPDVVVLPHRLTYIAIPDRAEPVIGRPFTTRWS